MSDKLGDAEVTFLQNCMVITDDFEEHLESQFLKQGVAEMRKLASAALSLHYKAISAENYDFSEES